MLIEALDLHDVTVVGHSTGGGEVARYIGRHGTARVAKAVLISAVPPSLVRSGVAVANVQQSSWAWVAWSADRAADAGPVAG